MAIDTAQSHSGYQMILKRQRCTLERNNEESSLIILTVKEEFHLTNRGVEGFVRSVFRMMKINLQVPDHSTLSKCGKNLQIKSEKYLKIQASFLHFLHYNTITFGLTINLMKNCHPFLGELIC